jgi:hypothetical protein
VRHIHRYRRAGFSADFFFRRGDVFLHNVVSTFNPVAGEITLTERVKY